MFTSVMNWVQARAEKILIVLGGWIILGNMIGFWQLREMTHIEYLPDRYFVDSIIMKVMMISCGVLAIRKSIYSLYFGALAIGYSALLDLIGVTVFVPKTYIPLLITYLLIFYLIKFIKEKHNKTRNVMVGSVEPPIR